MTEEIAEAGPRAESRWQRVLRFPLTLMVIAILAFAAGATLSVLLSNAIVVPPRSPLLVVRAAVACACFILFYWLFCRFIERAPMRDFGLAGWWRELLAGFAGGALIFSAVVGAATLLGNYRIAGPGDAATFWGMFAAMALIPGVTEELLFRGILFRFIEQTAGSWWALAATSALFGFAHIGNPNATVIAAVAIAVEAGLLLGAVYMLTRRLWAVIGLHAAWNLTQGWVFGLPVSGSESGGLVDGRLSGPELLTGGGFGLEASLTAMVVATAAGIAVLIVAIRRGELVQPMWARKRVPADA